MLKFNFSWHMHSEKRSFDEKTRCGFWMLELDSEWKVKCLCQQTRQRNPAFIEVHRKSLGGERIIAGTLEIHEEKGQCLLKKKFICLLEDNCRFTEVDLKCFPNTIPPPKMFLVTGEITIGAHTEASFDLTELVHMTKTDYSSLKQLSDDMEMLLLEKSLLTDVSLKSGAVSIPAHKSILSARSSVFDIVFSCTAMKEAMENEVVIEDIEASIFKDVVKCIYTGKIEGIELYGPKIIYLLYIANKYQITCVECICSKFLMHFMSREGVLIIPLLKDFGSPDLKNFVIHFMCNTITNFSVLEKQKIWIDWRNEHPALALEICSAVIKFQEQKLKRRI